MVNQGERWIEAEIEFLKENFHEGIDYCSQRLGRSIKGIRKQARKIGLVMSRPPKNGYRRGSRREWRERAKCFI